MIHAMTTPDIATEMRLFSPDGERLYLNSDGRDRFLTVLNDEDPSDRMFCQLPHYTGCRPARRCS